MVEFTRRRFIKNAVVGAASVGTLSQMNRLAYAVPADKGWIRLFDGETLKGWHKNRAKIAHGTGGLWQVENGAITGEQDPPGSGNGGILLTDDTFMDFELMIDIKPDWGVCSGLFLRGNEIGQCLQMMVDYHDNGKMGFLYGEGTKGFNCQTFDINGKMNDQNELVGLTTAPSQSLEEAGVVSACTEEDFVKAYNVDDWNHCRVQVTGKDPHVTTWINEVQICEFDGPTTSNKVYVENREEILNVIGKPGNIAVQVHVGDGWPKGAKCWWKQILIRRI